MTLVNTRVETQIWGGTWRREANNLLSPYIVRPTTLTDQPAALSRKRSLRGLVLQGSYDSHGSYQAVGL